MSEDKNKAPSLKDQFITKTAPRTADECSMEDLAGHNFAAGPCCDNAVRKAADREVPRSEYH